MGLVEIAFAALASCPQEEPPFRTLRVGIVVFEGVELLDFAGPAEVFTCAGGQLRIEERPLFEVVTVAPSKEPVLAHGGVTVLPAFALAEKPRLDLLVIPGGETGSLSRDPAIYEALRALAADATLVMSVCNGCYVLEELGLLAEAPPRARVVDHGRVVATGSVSCGIDGALHVVARFGGKRLARTVADFLQYRWQPEPRLEGAYSDWTSIGGLRVELAQQVRAYRKDENWVELERAARDLTELEPENRTAWFFLGYALIRFERFDEAIDANEEAARDPGWRPSALFNAAISRAHEGDEEAAIETLGRAVDAGFTRSDYARSDAGLRSLQDDPRFQALLARMDEPRKAAASDGWATEQLGLGRRWLERGEPELAVRSLLAAMDSLNVSEAELRVLLQSACARSETPADDATDKARRWLAAHPWPGRVILAPADEPGDRLVVSGVVRDASGQPLAGAKLHLFQADANGHYRPERAMNEPQARLNGWIVTSADGRYELESVRPGGYPKPRGDLPADAGDERWIPQHVHFEVEAPGRATRRFQLVFEDDPRMTEVWRKWARDDRHPVIALQKDPAGVLRGSCDVVLE